jgi:membrane protein YdbS with pleckstrin-like domain
MIEFTRPSHPHDRILVLNHATELNAYDDASAGHAASLDSDSGTWLRVDPRYVDAERLVGWIFFAVATIGLLVGLGILTFFQWPPGIAMALVYLASLIVLAMLFWVVHFLPAIHYRHLTYRLETAGFEIRRGWLWKRQVTVPISRVQHTDVAQGPLQRRFGIGKLIVYTAGTQNASVELDGLGFIEATRLRDALLVAGEEADGV